MKTLKSKACPECSPHGETGYWEASSWKGTKRCANCGHEENYTPKTPRPDRGTTKSQRREMDRIRGYLGRTGEITEWREKHLDSGPLSLVIDVDGDHPVTRMHYHFFVSRRGKLEVATASGVMASDNERERVAKALNGHVRSH